MDTAPAAEPCAALSALLSQHDVLAVLLARLEPQWLARAACACTDMRAAAKHVWVAVRARHWPHAAVALNFRAGAPPPPPPAHEVCAAYGAAAAHAGAQPPPVPPLNLRKLRFSVCITRADGDRAVVFAGTMRGEKFRDGTCVFDADVPLESAWLVPWEEVEDAALVASLFVERQCARKKHHNEVACLFTGRPGRLRQWQCEDDSDSEDALSYDDMEETLHRTFLFPYEAADVDMLPVAPVDEGAWCGRIDLKLRLTFVVPETEKEQPAKKSGRAGTDEAEDAAFERAVRVPSTPLIRASLEFKKDFDDVWHSPHCMCRCRDHDHQGPQPIELDDLAFALNSLSWHAL